MKILSRYIFKEMIGPTALGLGFYTFILMMKTVFGMAEMIIKRSLPFGTVLQLLALSLPHVLVLTIPMALLFGILIAVGRLSADSEIIAMRSAGVSTTQIYRPVFYFSFAVFLMNLWMMNVMLPAGNTRLEELKVEIFTTTVERDIQPRVFYAEYDNRVIYIDDVDSADASWKGVFISDTTDPDRQQIIVAEKGRISAFGNTGQLWLDLQNAQNHIYNARKPERYDLTRNGSQRFLLPDKFSEQGARNKFTNRDIRAMNVLELLEVAEMTKNTPRTTERNLALVEIHKKFSFPVACLAFGIVGLPLGITNRRGGKSSGFSLSIAIILVYYILVNNGEDLAASGKLHPAIGMWLPNIALFAFGLYLLRRANADSGDRRGFTMDRLVHRLTQFFKSKRNRAEESGSEEGLISKMDIAFPNTLDRYVLKEFTKVLALVVISAASLFVIVNYTELAGDIVENQVSFAVVLSYFRYYVLQVFGDVLPISVLLGTLVTFGIFSKNNEITAMKAHGISLYRLSLPILALAVLISAVSYFLHDFVLPYSNERVARLKAQIRGRESRKTFSVQQRQWVFGKGRYLFNFLSYGKTEKTMYQVQVFEFDPVDFKLTRRVFTDEARWDGTGWVFVNGWIRSFSDDGTSSYSPINTPIRLFYPERPEYFATDVKAPNQMTFAELRRYVNDLRRSGYAADELTVKLYEKTAWPFISLVMAMIALPFSFRLGKQGALYGVGIAMFVAFAYWMVFGIFTKFGEVGNLPAVLSAWSANIIFMLAAMYLFLRVET